MLDNKIIFVPSETVSFKSLTQKQVVQLIIKNKWERPIIFKMKTTRPQLFKMRPVFGLIETGQEKTIRLTFKGFDSKEKPPCSRDRFTIVIAPAPDNCIDPARVWKQQKCPEVLVQTARKVLRIEYGETDNSKVVSARPKVEPKTPEQLEELRKAYPNLPDDILQYIPLPLPKPKASTTNTTSPSPQPSLTSKSSASVIAPNNNDVKKGKDDKKDTTEDSSSSSSED